MYSALGPVSAAVFEVLQDSQLQAQVTGGWHDDVPQNFTLPFGWYEVKERDVRGFGTGGMMEIDLRLHVFSEYGGMAQAQEGVRLAIRVFRDQGLNMVGWNMAGRIFFDETLPFADEELNGVKVHEVVALLRFYVEEIEDALQVPSGWMQTGWTQA